MRIIYTILLFFLNSYFTTTYKQRKNVKVTETKPSKIIRFCSDFCSDSKNQLADCNCN